MKLKTAEIEIETLNTEIRMLKIYIETINTKLGINIKVDSLQEINEIRQAFSNRSIKTLHQVFCSVGECSGK